MQNKSFTMAEALSSVEKNLQITSLIETNHTIVYTVYYDVTKLQRLINVDMV